MTRFPKLAGLAEVAGLAGVSRKRAWQLTQHKDFPKPVQPLAMGPVWLESDVQAFLDTPRPGGRQRVRDNSSDLRTASEAGDVNRIITEALKAETTETEN